MIRGKCRLLALVAVLAVAPEAQASDRSGEVDDPDVLLDFIPVVAYRKVLDTHANAEASEIPSGDSRTWRSISRR